MNGVREGMGDGRRGEGNDVKGEVREVAVKGM